MVKKALTEFKYLEDWHDPTKKPYILVEGVSKSYKGTSVLNHISLDVYKGEFFSLLGPSGCGKSTLLRILAGLETPDAGRIFIDGVDMTSLPAYERPVNMMFQSYALFPHMTVEENVAFGLKQEGLSRQEIRERVEEMLKLVKLEKYSQRRPHQLSGGQKQRTALARCLIKKPKLVLLDEPLAALDKKLRSHTQFELVNIQDRVGVTFITVTHDQEEAMTMSTRMGVMEEGRIRQVGTPNEIYEFPNSEYVADFIGTTNIFYGIVEEEGAEYTIVKSDELKARFHISHASGIPIGSQVSIAIRPEKILINKKRPKAKYNYARGIVKNIAYLGDVSIYYVQIQPSQKILMAMIPNFIRQEITSITWDDEVFVSWHSQNPIILTT